MTEVTENMPIDVVDENDIPIGVIERSQVFRQRANFRATIAISVLWARAVNLWANPPTDLRVKTTHF